MPNVRRTGRSRVRTTKKTISKVKRLTKSLKNLKLKLKASGLNKKTQETYTQKPALFDAKKNPFPVDKSIWGGSKVKIAFDLVPYSVASIGTGVTARIKAVQIIELVEGSSKEDNLFKVEDGYTSEINTNNETSAVQANSDF